MSADTLGPHIYLMAVGWTASSGPTYMSAGTLGVCIYLMAVGWTTSTGFGSTQIQYQIRVLRSKNYIS